MFVMCLDYRVYPMHWFMSMRSASFSSLGENEVSIKNSRYLLKTGTRGGTVQLNKSVIKLTFLSAAWFKYFKPKPASRVFNKEKWL